MNREKQKEKLKNKMKESSYRAGLIDLFVQVKVKTPFDEEKKKKKKRKKLREVEGPISLETMRAESENYKNYLKLMKRFCILKGLTEERYILAIRRIKQLCKSLKKGDAEKVYNSKRVEEYMHSKDYHDQYL